MMGKIRDILKSQSGFTLTELMIAAGLSGMIGLSVAQLTKNTGQVFDKSKAKSDERHVHNLITSRLSNSQSCLETFGQTGGNGLTDVTVDNAVPNLYYVSSTSGTSTVLTVGSKVPGLDWTVKSMTLKARYSTGTMNELEGINDLEVWLEAPQEGSRNQGSSEKMITVPIKTSLADTSVASCIASSSGTPDDSNIWELVTEAGNEHIVYNGIGTAKVGIGHIPDASSQKLTIDAPGGVGQPDGKMNLDANNNYYMIGGYTVLNVGAGTNTVSGGRQALQNAPANSTVIGYNAATAATGTDLTALGYQALAANTTGAYNSALGYNALAANVSGNNNTAVGHGVLQAAVNVSNNTCFGMSACTSITAHDNNTAYGASSQSLAQGGWNTSLGYESLMGSGTPTGDNNIAVGYRALKNFSTASTSVAIGSGALDKNSTQFGMVAVGLNALGEISSGSHSVAVGSNAAGATDSSSVVAIGFNAFSTNSSSLSTNTVAIGSNAMQYVIGGGSNTAIGSQAYRGVFSTTSGNSNTMAGYNAGVALTSGTQNTAAGSLALEDLTTGNSNVAVGYMALTNATTSSDNTAVGYQAMGGGVVSGGENTAVGWRSLYNAATSATNVAIGFNSMLSSSGNSFNVALGYNAFASGLSDSNHNVIAGYTAGDALTSFALNNVVAGYNSMGGTTGSDRNVALGYNSMSTTSTNVGYNVAIGASASTDEADYAVTLGANSFAHGDNATALGYDADASGDHSVSIVEGSTASGNNSVAIGRTATASGDSAVAIGWQTTCAATGSTCIYKADVIAGASYGIAMGTNAQVNHIYSGVLSSSEWSVLNSTTTHVMMMEYSGGYWFHTVSNASTGPYLATAAGSWSTISDKNKKTDFVPSNGEEVLQKLMGMDISYWNYKTKAKNMDDERRLHLGPVAQDFWAAFGLGYNDKKISTNDADGIILVGAKAVIKRTDKLKTENEELRTEAEAIREEQKELFEMANQIERMIASKTDKK